MGININTATPEELAAFAAYFRPPVLTSYPALDATKAGQRFIYKGEEWHYMTQEEIDSCEWTGLADVGFPAPVEKSPSLRVLINAKHSYSGNLFSAFSSITVRFNGYDAGETRTTDVNFIGLGINVNEYKSLNLRRTYGGIAVFKNAHFLTNLEDVGTNHCLDLSSPGPTVMCDASTLNDLFTQLPPTTKTATINLLRLSGAATCDTSIATTKGYTVIT